MASKKKAPVVVVKCECSTCKQVAIVEPGKVHHYCHGLKGIVKPLPDMFKDLKGPHKGTWAPIGQKETVGA
jgi:hypothetical protein